MGSISTCFGGNIMNIKLRVVLMTDEGESFYGPGVQTLLIAIRDNGSVKEACIAMNLSYSKGRRILKKAEAALGYQLVRRQQGGALGGSAMITPQAELFIKRYENLTDSVNDYSKMRMNELFPREGIVDDLTGE